MSGEPESRNIAVAEGNRCCSPDGQHSRHDIGAMKLRRIQDLPSSPREHLEPIGEAPGLRGQQGRQTAICSPVRLRAPAPEALD
jgi:hypothetical protein